MKIDYDGRTWALELDDIDLPQGEKITAATGLSVLAWLKSMTDTDSLGWATSMRVLYWVMCQQNDVAQDLESANCKPLKLLKAFGAAQDQDAEPEEVAEDPTKPAGDFAAG